MKNVKELKQSIAPRMRKCWGESCAAFIISAGGLCAAVFAWYIIMNTLVSMGIIENAADKIMLTVTAILALFMLVITVPYNYGLRWYRLQQVRGHSVHAKSIFSCYFSAKRLLQVYKLSAMLFLKKIFLLIPFSILLSAGIYLIIKFNTIGGGLGYNLVVVALLMLSALTYLAYNIINIKYAAAPYLYALGHDRPAGEIINESVQFMKGKQGYMIEVLRSCAIMLIPCIVVFPMIFVIPKMMMIYTAAINEIIEDGFEKDKLVNMERREKFASR
ncbi:MAG: hypothetical protein IJC04_05300 [Oscillospiraceae bacterium]|nr:hypothetical protein [Oscillospiraceae bacterium]